MKIIKFFSSFATSDGCIEAYTRIHELYSDPDFNKTYKFTCNDDYTHAIILNTAMPKVTIPKENVIGLAFEPIQFLGLTSVFIDYAINNISKYYLGDNTGLPDCFINHYSYMWHMTPYTYIPEKTKIMSIMVSDKNNAPGHKYRHLLVQAILKSNLQIDIYGKGCKFYNNLNDPRIKGEFKETEPYENYKFHIAIENFQTSDYFSEKITNTLLSNTCPVYLGAKNIDKYFDNIIKLIKHIETDLSLLEDIINNVDKYYITQDIDKIKKTLSIKNVIDIFHK